MGVTCPQQLVTADTAFLMQGGISKNLNIPRDIHVSSFQKPTVGITLHRWRYPGNDRKVKQQEYINTLAAFCDIIVQRHDVKISFIPMNYTGSFFDERPMASSIISKMVHSKRAEVLIGEPSPMEIMQTIENLECIVGTRFHSVIFGMLTGVPPLAISYEHKAVGIMAMMGLTNYTCAIETLSTFEMASKYFKIMENAKSISEVIRSRLPTIKQLAHLNIVLIRALSTADDDKANGRLPLALVFKQAAKESERLLKNLDIPS